MSDILQDLRAQKLEAEIAYLGAQKKVEDLKERNYRREVETVESQADGARIFTFYAPVHEGAVAKCMADLGNWSRRFPGKEITVIFNSPGGSVTDGFALFDFLRDLSQRGHHITTKALGLSASMGAILLQAGDTRIIGPNSFILIHEVGAGVEGALTQLEDNVKIIKKWQDQALDILASRSSWSRTKIKNAWKRRDVMLNAAEALKAGFVDEIA